MLVNVRCQRSGSWTEKNAGLPENKRTSARFWQALATWVDYHHLLSIRMAFGDALFTYQFVILIVSSITDAYLTVSF